MPEAVLGRSLCFVAGALAVLWCPVPVAVPVAVQAAVLLAALAAALAWRGALSLLACLAGACCAQAAVAQHLAGLPQQEERLLVEAVVTGLPRQLADGWQFDARLWFPRGPSRAAVRARLAWHRAGAAAPQVGERWQLAVQLQPPLGTFNPGAIDTERNLLRDHVQATGSVLRSALNRRLRPAGGGLQPLRGRLAAHIRTRVADPAAGPLLAALAVGVTTEVTPAQWRIFSATGITHLVAISGMHVTVFAVAAMAAARRAWRPLARRGLRWRRERFAAVAGLLLATLYALLAGFSVPTQRTLLMLGAWLLWREAARGAQASASLAVAAVVIVATDPFALLSAGFWLSFLAVAAIIGFVGGRRPAPRGWRAAAAVQLAVTVALLPLTLALFGSHSVAGIAVNVVAIPLFSWLLVPPVLLATALLLLPLPPFTALADLLLGIAGAVATAALPPLAAVAALPGATWQVQPPAAWHALALVGVLLAVLPFARRLRFAGVLCVLPLLPAGRGPLPPGAFDVTVLDTGRPAAVLVEAPGHALLFGTGEQYGTRGARLEGTVLPYLRHRRLPALDRLVAGRLDRDVGEAVTAALAAGALAGRPVVAWPRAGEGLPPEYAGCAAQPVTRHGGVTFELLPAGAGGACVLRVVSPAGALLAGGDLDAPSAAALAVRHVLRADVLVLPRGGSAAATTPALLADVAPRLAIAAPGRAALATDAWQAVVTRHRAAGIRLLDTTTAGALRIEFRPGEPPRVVAAREGRAGIWRWPGERAAARTRAAAP